ncbi:zinc-finger domain-containing protein [Bacillus cereus]
MRTNFPMKSEKQSIRIQILNLQDKHCVGCAKVPTYRKSGNRKTSWCTENCEIGERIKRLGDQLLEGRTENMAEERNWDQLCEKAEKLRVEKLSWAKIADRLGVSESALYHNIAKRREGNKTPVKRVGASENHKNTKTLSAKKNVVEKKSELDAEWKEQLKRILDEKDTLEKDVAELDRIKDLLSQDYLAEKTARSETEKALELSQEQLRNRDEDYNNLLNEFNQLSEKKREVEVDSEKYKSESVRRKKQLKWSGSIAWNYKREHKHLESH